METDINITPPNQPVQPKSSFVRKNFTPRFIATIIGILILGGTAYGYATYLAKKNFDKVSRVAAEAKRQEEELKQRRLADVTDIASWRTYRNEEYGFEVQYPTKWQQEIFPSATPIVREEKTLVTFYSNQKAETPNLPAITISVTVIDNPHKITLQERLQKIYCPNVAYCNQVGLNVYNWPQISIGGHLALEPNRHSKDHSLNYVYVYADTKIIGFSSDIYSKDIASHYNLFNQILSTFKFIK
jgi:hypothetical protein